MDYPVALEAPQFKEITFEHAEEFAEVEFKHETLAMLTENTPVFPMATRDGVKTGIDTALNAGVRLDVGVTTVPGETVMEDRGEF